MLFANGEIYHIFNRGIEKRPTFTDKREFERALLTINYYRFANLPVRLSQALLLGKKEREELFSTLSKKFEKLVEVICFCLMPNHFHFLLRQEIQGGVSKFLSNFANSYTRYFNTKNEGRIGSLFQGIFKSVRMEDEDQFLHVNRYIHINPSVSYMVKKEELESYQWSSLPEYLELSGDGICEKELVLSFFRSKGAYRKFLFDQIDYAKSLDKIKHLLLE